MVPERRVLLGFNLAFSVLLLLLLLDDGKELVTLGLGLLCEHHFSLKELSASSLIELDGLLGSKLLFFDLFFTGLALSFFESSLGA